VLLVGSGEGLHVRKEALLHFPRSEKCHNRPHALAASKILRLGCRTPLSLSVPYQPLSGHSSSTPTGSAEKEKHHDASIGYCWSISLALAPISAGAQQIFACVNANSGAVRIVAQGAACRSPESLVTWNVVGPQGPPGPAGPAGALGPPGLQGPVG
jgi:hypothetical protein